MYLVTNRDIKSDSGRIDDVFSDVPNSEGPNNLRVADTKKSGKKWSAEILADELTPGEAKTLAKDFSLKIDTTAPHYVDLRVACDVAHQARTKKRNILIFIHGYNNDVEDVLHRAANLEKHYGVIVLPFSWPANGGGIKGVADYRDDKNDAKASIVALDRFLYFVSRNLTLITESNRNALWAKATQRHSQDPEKRDALYTQLVDKSCPFTLNLLLHSMGNYLLKQMFKSTISKGTGLIFDNVVMVAADTNNLDHSLWVDHIRFKRRLYITINEDDKALSASRMKSGQDQLARLGHVLFGLNASRAHYVNFTDSPWVKDSHAYFEGDARAKNTMVHNFFDDALNGRSADKHLKYRADNNWYELKTR